jgi:hypothetical protein
MAGPRTKEDGMDTIKPSIIHVGLPVVFLIRRVPRLYVTPAVMGRPSTSEVVRSWLVVYERILLPLISEAMAEMGCSFVMERWLPTVTRWLLNSRTYHTISPIHSTMSSNTVQALEYLQLDNCAASMLNHNSRR